MTKLCILMILIRILWEKICPRGEAMHVARVQPDSMLRVRLHNHDFYEWFYVEAAGGTHLLEGKHQPLVAGDMVFIRPEHTHGFKTRNSSEFTILNVALRCDVVEAFLKRNNHLGDIWQKGAPSAKFRLSNLKVSSFTHFSRDLTNGGRMELDADWCLASLFRLMARTEANETADDFPAWLSEALIELSSPGFALDKGVHELVRVCGRSPEHVARQFRLHLKKSPTEWIAEARMGQACRLLETTNMSITEVALDCGIENLSHFHRQFKKAFGTTPLKHRKSNRSVIP